MENVDTLLIDGPGLVIASTPKSYPGDKKAGAQSAATLDRMMSYVFDLMDTYPGAMPVMLWGVEAEWRRSAYADYQSLALTVVEYGQASAWVARQAPIIQKMLSTLGIPQAIAARAEPCDIADLVSRSAPDDMRFLLVSRDMSWVQAVSENISVLDPIYGQLVTQAKLQAGKFRHMPLTSGEQFLEALCLAGYTEKSLGGVSGVGKRTAVQVLAEHDSLEAFWQHVDSGGPVRGKRLQLAAGPEARAGYQRNRQLLDWKMAELPNKVALEREPAKMPRFLDLAGRYGLNGIAERGRAFFEQESFRPRQARWEGLTADLNDRISAALSDTESPVARRPRMRA